VGLDSNLMLKQIVLEKDKIDSMDKYPFNIELVKNFEELTFTSPVISFVYD
jgi:predicted ATPase